ncbi:MAG: GNAT family N-acetyltransferase, partial [Candidatus Thorarchaeota archaeon]
MTVTFRWGFKENEQTRIAEILYDALSEKFNPVFGNRPRSIPFIKQALIPSRIVLAHIDSEVIGVAGLQFNNQGYLETSLRNAWKSLRWGVFRMIFNGWVLESKVSKDALYLDTIAVDEHNRGRGVGKLLIDEIIQFARKKGFSFVKLAVVNTNSRAKSLYERLGFKEVKIEKMPYPWSRTFGFSSASE